MVNQASILIVLTLLSLVNKRPLSAPQSPGLPLPGHGCLATVCGIGNKYPSSLLESTVPEPGYRDKPRPSSRT
ncbi:hypothetical protein QBC36DRAFT_319174 [Triangularia setosa]|uniref:Secreted protein n=1 Tax=Triangularia setosa TaxID=2587417 RepID=A0AAN7AB78_9PEZI|nr:hypothetical protein QBC36DRAFT_319174 [Podospora setosa]